MISLWHHVYGGQRGVQALFSGARLKPGSKELEDTRTAYLEWPSERDRARSWVERETTSGRETYHCAHLLTGRRRVKANAAPVLALWVDGGGAEAKPHTPEPTAVVESSPGREQVYWRLSEPVAPEVGERLNRRASLPLLKSGKHSPRRLPSP